MRNVKRSRAFAWGVGDSGNRPNKGIATGLPKSDRRVGLERGIRPTDLTPVRYRQAGWWDCAAGVVANRLAAPGC